LSPNRSDEFVESDRFCHIYVYLFNSSLYIYRQKRKELSELGSILANLKVWDRFQIQTPTLYSTERMLSNCLLVSPHNPTSANASILRKEPTQTTDWSSLFQESPQSGDRATVQSGRPSLHLLAIEG
jgi:hypothetical protein